MHFSAKKIKGCIFLHPFELSFYFFNLNEFSILTISSENN